MDGQNGIKAVFFDLGKVMLRFDHGEIVDRLLSRTRPEDRRPDELFGFLFDMDEGLCNLYDEGKVSSREFYGAIDRRFGLSMSYDSFVPLWDDIFTENKEVSGLVREVRKARPVYLLSNVNELHWEFARTRFPVLSELDGWVLSYKVGAKKPAKAIYRAALKEAGAEAGETVFIDDMEENTRAAEGCGIRGITFKDAAQARESLIGLGLIK
jgi:FMN phosphatase YigB (HAD superfamily)